MDPMAVAGEVDEPLDAAVDEAGPEVFRQSGSGLAEGGIGGRMDVWLDAGGGQVGEDGGDGLVRMEPAL